MAELRRHQVFVSSTFKDLVEERAAVIRSLLEIDCVPAGMEMFPASDSQKFDLIKSVIDLCDYYIVIIGGRYGSVDDAVQLSYTEMEYDYAIEQKIPVLAFLHKEPGSIPYDKSETDGEYREKLAAFRSKTEERVVKYWADPNELSAMVVQGIIQTQKSHPRPGWIRAGDAMTPEVQNELAELRIQVRELESDLATARGAERAGYHIPDLAQGDDEYEIRCILTYHRKSTIEEGKGRTATRDRGWWGFSASWNSIFKSVLPALMDESSEADLLGKVEDFCADEARDSLIHHDEETGPSADTDPQDGDLDPISVIYEAAIDGDSFDDIKVQLAALGLIEKGTRKRSTTDANTYWKLTGRGEALLVQLRAIRRSTK